MRIFKKSHKKSPKRSHIDKVFGGGKSHVHKFLVFWRRQIADENMRKLLEEEAAIVAEGVSKKDKVPGSGGHSFKGPGSRDRG